MSPKIKHHFRNKICSILKLSKNVFYQKCGPKLIFFNEKKIEKDSDNFWYRKLTLKVGRLGDFALFGTSPLVQFSKFKKFLWVCWFLGKNLSNFVPPVWKLHNPYCHSGHHRPNQDIPLQCIFFNHQLTKIMNFFTKTAKEIGRRVQQQN